MKRGQMWSLCSAMLVTAVAPVVTYGQGNQGVNTPAAQYFANRSLGNQRAQYQSQGLGTQNYVPAPQQVQISGSKPFQNIQHAPTLSPYLALDLFETTTQLPNYQAFVQPQIQQRAANESQARELQRLRQQVRVATAHGVVSKNATPGVPTTGSSSQFMNMGSYFPDRR